MQIINRLFTRVLPSLLLILSLISLTCPAAQTQVSAQIKNFAKDDEWDNVKISPTGDYLSAVTRVNGKKVIALLDAKTLKPLHSLKFNGFAQPGDYHWVNHERIISEKEYLKGWQDTPVGYGEYFAVNANGRRAKYVFGYLKAQASKNMWGELIDPMPDDKRYILVKGTKMSNTTEHLAKVYRVDVRKGRLTSILESPVKQARFLTDQHHNVRFVTGFDEKNQHKTFLYQDEKWLSTSELNIDNESFYPVTIKGDSNKVYAIYSEKGEPSGLYLFDLDTGKKELVFQHDKVSVSASNVKYDNSGHVYAVEYDDGYPTTKIIDNTHPQAKVLKKWVWTNKVLGMSG
jgi:hypothetical protein